MSKSAQQLAIDYEFENQFDYFNYILDSQINGQRKQVKELFDQMNNSSKHAFMFYVGEDALHAGYTQQTINKVLTTIFPEED